MAFAVVKVRKFFLVKFFFGDITYEKGYNLVTFLQAKEECLKRRKWRQYNKIFLERESGVIVEVNTSP